MSYRVTKRQRERLAAMRAAKERRRMEGNAPDYPAELPRLRRRIDCYDVSVNGGPRHRRAGWSRIVAETRNVFPRVLSPRSACN